MLLLLVGHAVAGVAILLAARRLRRSAFLIGAVPMVAVLGYAAARAPAVLDGETISSSTPWVAGLGLSISLRLDGFALLMTFVVAGIGVLVMGYGASYFPATARAARNAGFLVLFAGAMLTVVLAADVGLLYVGWELTSVTSFFLIGADHERAEARRAALHALLVTGAGGLALLGGLVLLAQEAGTWSISGIIEAAPTGPVAGTGLALVVAGIVTKSAQFPFHTWLPGAMVAATPVSAYLHSATMVKAGIYLAARLAPAFAVVAVWWRPTLLTVGLVTMVVGGVRAMRQDDLKLLLAMGTISQLGFLLVLFSAGLPEATVAGCVLLVAHAVFKATLFLVVGVIDHQSGTRDRRQLHGLGRGWAGVKVAAAVAAASMIGLPPVLGFVAKESAFEAFLHHGGWGLVVLAGLVGGSMLTVAYTVRFVAPVLAPASPDADRVPAPSLAFVAAPGLLAVLTVAGGVAVGGLVGPFVDAAAGALDPEVGDVYLALWHGVNTPLVLSAVTLLGGALLVVGRAPVDAVLSAWAPRRGGLDAYGACIRGLNAAARGVAGVTQSGSLPVYIAVILSTAVALPGWVLITRATWPGWPVFARTPTQVLLAAVVVVAAVASAAAARRFTAVVLLGAVGYGMALVFVVQGAPDLALTQFAIETLTVVAFVLVLRYLPARFEVNRPAVDRPIRLAISAVVAVAVFGFAIVAGSVRRLEPIGAEMVVRALPEADGRNVVNVVLVDFRGLDTLGEIAVVAAAAVGVVALSRVGRGDRRRSEMP